MLKSLAILLALTWITIVFALTDQEFVKPGEPKLLICPGSSDNPKWIRPNQKLKEELKEELKEDDRHVFNRTAGTVNITVVGEDDVGNFTCVDKNNAEYIVTVNTSPYVIRMSKSVNHVVGETATLECSAWGTEPLELLWHRSKDGKTDVLTSANESVVITRKKDTRANHITETLEYANLTYTDYSFYYCVAKNLYGNASSSTNVRVKDKLAALYPFIGICIEILILVIIIIIYEKRKSKRTDDEDGKKPDTQSNANDHKGEENVRFRK